MDSRLLHALPRLFGRVLSSRTAFACHVPMPRASKRHSTIAIASLPRGIFERISLATGPGIRTPTRSSLESRLTQYPPTLIHASLLGVRSPWDSCSSIGKERMWISRGRRISEETTNPFSHLLYIVVVDGQVDCR
eukprot:scaffold79_cov259-Pinguiococcus_pyrenoidosus.AAC.24